MSQPSFNFITYRQLKDRLNQWLPKLGSFVKPNFQPPVDLQHGLMSSNLAFQLAAVLKRNPTELATELQQDLENYLTQAGLPLKATTSGAYLNLEPTEQFYALMLGADLSKDLVVQDKSRVMLEYIGANVAKRLHAGHMRNLNIGEALRRIFKLKYPNLKTDNHWGDWGVQFGIIIWAYKQAPVNHVAYKLDPVEELQRLYVWGNRQKDKTVGWDRLVRQEFLKLEQGDIENRRLWQEFVDFSKTALESDLRLMNVPNPDIDQGESFYESDMQKLTQFMNDDEVWQKEGQARYFDFDKLAEDWQGLDGHKKEKIKKLGRAYLISSDGYTTYCYRDVAARWQWARDHKTELAITVTDKTQNHNFEQAFAIINYLVTLPGFKKLTDDATTKRLRPGSLVHIGYGFLELTSGKMSSRKGNVLKLSDLIKEVADAAYLELVKRDEGLSKKEAESRAQVVAQAALKWADLNRDPVTDVVLDAKKIVEFEGNTGAYQLYTYARLRSVLRKAGFGGADRLSSWQLSSAEELILRQIYSFSGVIEQAIQSYKPNLVTNHLLVLTNEINSWYNSVPVTKESDENRRQQLLQLCFIMSDHLKFSLDLLGIAVLEKM